MNKKIIFKYILIFFLVFLPSCNKEISKIQKPKKIPPLNILYKEAFNALEESRLQEALELFQQVETNYSYTEWAPRSTLMIAYMYYEVGRYVEALQYLNKFKKNYPANKNVIYAEYLIGLCLYEMINISSRDQTNSFLAKKQFKKILTNYPGSTYADDSKLKIDLINEQIAGNHMYIARYYMKKSKWTSALVRLNIIEKEFSDTIYIIETLHRFVEIYYKLGNIKLAKQYAAILGYNFNDSDWYKKTYKIVGNKDYFKTNKIQKKKLREKILNMFNFSK